jgi:hypothetical protein
VARRCVPSCRFILSNVLFLPPCVLWKPFENWGSNPDPAPAGGFFLAFFLSPWRRSQKGREERRREKEKREEGGEKGKERRKKERRSEKENW